MAPVLLSIARPDGKPEAEKVKLSPSASLAPVVRLTVAPTSLDWLPIAASTGALLVGAGGFTVMLTVSLADAAPSDTESENVSVMAESLESRVGAVTDELHTTGKKLIFNFGNHFVEREHTLFTGFVSKLNN